MLEKNIIGLNLYHQLIKFKSVRSKTKNNIMSYYLGYEKSVFIKLKLSLTSSLKNTKNHCIKQGEKNVP